MIGTIYRMHGFYGLFLSPQSSIDSRVCRPQPTGNRNSDGSPGLDQNWDEIKKFLCDMDFGLESNHTYPLIKKRRGTKLNLKAYTNRKYPRYVISDMSIHYDMETIKKKILLNFGDDGPNYPLVASIILGDFHKPELAKHHANLDNLPYRPPPPPPDESSTTIEPEKRQKTGRNKKPRPEDEKRLEDNEGQRHRCIPMQWLSWESILEIRIPSSTIYL